MLDPGNSCLCCSRLEHLVKFSVNCSLYACAGACGWQQPHRVMEQGSRLQQQCKVLVMLTLVHMMSFQGVHAAACSGDGHTGSQIMNSEPPPSQQRCFASR